MKLLSLIRTNPKSVLLILLATVLMFSLSQDDTDLNSDEQSAKIWTNRIWINRMPKNSRDMVNQLAFIRMDEGRFGVFAHASRWRANLENFVWKRDGKIVDIFLPQEHRRTKVKLVARKCDNTAPKGFELCLTVKSGQKVAEFYSRKAWIIRPHQPELLENGTPHFLRSSVERLAQEADTYIAVERDGERIFDFDEASSWPAGELEL